MVKKSIVERISDVVKDIVDTASTAAADALKPDPEAVAATTNEQVYVPKATDVLIARKKKRAPTPFRATKSVAAAKGRTTKAPKKAAPKKTGKKAAKKAGKKAAAKKSAKRAPTKAAKKAAAKKSKSKSKSKR